VRVTAEERAALEALRAAVGGPRHLGPWLVWRAFQGENFAAGGHLVRYDRENFTGPPAGYDPAPIERVLPGVQLGYYPAPRLGSTAGVQGRAAAPVVPVSERRILDLCGGSGAWSAPYRAAGYPVTVVTLPADDVRTWALPDEGPWWGVLAAPPCDQFSVARNGHPELPRDLRAGLEVVGACLRVIYAARPRWWALENPTGLLGRWLGVPGDVFEPCDFGDPWTKRTALWGHFVLPRRGPFVEPRGSAMDRGTAAARAVTPPGFARAFCEANP